MLLLKRLWLVLVFLGMGLWVMPAHALQAFPWQCQCLVAVSTGPEHHAEPRIADAEDEYCVPRQTAPQPKPCPVACSRLEQPANLEKAAPPVQSPEKIQAAGLFCLVQLAHASIHPRPPLPSGLPVAWCLPTSPPISSHHLNLPPPELA